MLQLSVGKDNESTPIYALPITDAGFMATLNPEINTVLIVPEGTRYAIIAGSDHYFVSLSGISLPPVGSFAAADFEQDKQVVAFPRGSPPATVLNFYARNITDITVSLWR